MDLSTEHWPPVLYSWVFVCMFERRNIQVTCALSSQSFPYRGTLNSDSFRIKSDILNIQVLRKLYGIFFNIFILCVTLFVGTISMRDTVGKKAQRIFHILHWPFWVEMGMFYALSPVSHDKFILITYVIRSKFLPIRWISNNNSQA